MPVLNTAANLRFGGQQVLGVKRRGADVWVLPVPVNTSPPVVSGAATEGDTATTTNGTWSNSPTSYEYRWQVDPGTGFEDVSGETASTYEDVPAGEYRSAVRGVNAFGAGEWAYSAPFVVSAAGGALATFNPTGATSTCEFSGGNTILTKTSGSAVAQCLTTHAIAEKTYFEVRCNSAGSSASGAQLYGGTSSLIDWAALGVWYGQPGCTIDVQQWSLSAYCNAGLPEAFSGALDFFDGANPATHDIYIAVDPATRAVWVSSDESPSAWYGGGDPAAGTSPTFYVGGSDPIFGSAYVDTGRTAILRHPDDFTRPSTPSGFRLGIAGGS